MVKHRFLMFFLPIVLISGLLCACGVQCEHDWNMECLYPASCMLCGITAGEALGHDWVDGDCTRAKTCIRCGVTEGSPLEHSWTGGQCGTVKTCTVCGKTDGEPVGHSWMAATCTAPITCADCGLTTGVALAHSYSDWMVAEGYVFLRTCTCCGAEERVPFTDLIADETTDADTRLAKYLRSREILMEFLSGTWVAEFSFFFGNTGTPVTVSFSNPGQEVYWTELGSYMRGQPQILYTCNNPDYPEAGSISDVYLWYGLSGVVNGPWGGVLWEYDEDSSGYYAGCITENGTRITVHLHPDYPYGVMQLYSWELVQDNLGATSNFFLKAVPDNPAYESLSEFYNGE